MKTDFDKAKLYDLINSFYAVTGIKVVIKDTAAKDVLAAPKVDYRFCSSLKENPKALHRCAECDKQHSRLCEKSGELIIYKCHMGLTEAIFPLKIDNVSVGYIMLGQVIEDNTDTAALLAAAKCYNEKITEADVFQMTRKSESDIKAAAKILEACAGFCLAGGLIRADYGSRAFKITNYINDNLSGDLSVEFLCARFGLSRNMLYKISNKYFGMPISRYIRKKRVQRALELINSGISVGNAASLTGFGDYSYFTKVVKAETGKKPKEFKA